MVESTINYYKPIWDNDLMKKSIIWYDIQHNILVFREIIL